ncbi:MFS transporter [Novosphingobium sp. YAF33]|uniref:MFS transporter n=1 Tax=Novosphingobium sp. YAF33 TaxID=3233082 RepID=UPI003F9C50FA
MNPGAKPELSLLRICEMNLGFFGLQFSFGLQQANMSPIYRTLGATEAILPLLWLAGPMTGLIVQPLVGAMSDRTRSRFGRRTPYFLIGAVICSLCLLAMPYSPSLWAAAALLWLLDAGNNVTMEPYRAYVADRLRPAQRATGFLTQSAFTGLAQTLSYLAPSLLAATIDRDLLDANGIPAIVRVAFAIGAVLSLSTVVWSLLRVPELPLAEADGGLQTGGETATSLAPRALLRELGAALREMPAPMRRLAPSMLCQWYAMFVYWQFITDALARSIHGTSDPATPAYRAAILETQQLGALYNAIAFAAALALIPLVRRFGAAWIHMACLAASGLAMLLIPQANSMAALAPLMIGLGLGWAGMMANPYIILASAIPPERTGLYVGLFNILIVAPMLIETVTMPLIYKSLLASDPRNALVLAGFLMLAGAGATLLAVAPRRPQRGTHRYQTDHPLPPRDSNS